MHRHSMVVTTFLGSALLASVTWTSACGAPKEGSGFSSSSGGGSGGASGSSGGSGGSSGSSGGSGGSSGGSFPSSSGGSSGGLPVGDGGVPCPAGLQCNVSCSGGGTTSVTGTVYDPAAKNPLYNISVYVPATALQPLPSGVPTGPDACSCSALFKSGALTSTVTDVKGNFTLTNVPVGSKVPLVIQVGKWRRSLTINVNACQTNAQPDKSLTLPGTLGASPDDNIPDIAVSTGSKDTLECLMRRIGMPASEYVAGPGTGGHVHVYSGGDPTGKTNGAGTPEGNPMPGAPESDTNLWDSQAHLMPYDITLLSCEGGETYNANPSVLEGYLNAGGRVFASHFHYAWFSGPIGSGQMYSAPMDWGTNLAAWTPGNNNNADPIGGSIVSTLNGSSMPFPKGVALQQWLQLVGALNGVAPAVPSGDLSIYNPRYNAVVGSTNVPSQSWITSDMSADKPGQTMYFSFDTPVSLMPPTGPDPSGTTYCGRAVFSDLHVAGDPSTSDNQSGPPPGGCANVDLSAQEKALEFMLFDLSSCVIPDTVQPPTMVPPPPQ